MKSGLLAVLHLWLCVAGAAIVGLGLAWSLIWLDQHTNLPVFVIFLSLVLVACISIPVYLEFEE